MAAAVLLIEQPSVQLIEQSGLSAQQLAIAFAILQGSSASLSITTEDSKAPMMEETALVSVILIESACRPLAPTKNTAISKVRTQPIANPSPNRLRIRYLARLLVDSFIKVSDFSRSSIRLQVS